MKREAAFWGTLATIFVSIYLVLLIFISPDPCAWFIVPVLVYVSLIILLGTRGRSRREG